MASVLAKAAYYALRFLIVNRDEESRTTLIATIAGVVGALFLVALIPSMVISYAWGSDGDEITTSTIYEKVEKVLDDKKNEWESDLVTGPPDEVHALAYLTVINKNDDVKKWNYKKRVISQFYDLTVVITITVIPGDEEAGTEDTTVRTVALKPLEQIAVDVFPDNEEHQELFKDYYVYYTHKVATELGIPVTGFSPGIANDTTSINTSLEDANVTTYSTGMAVPHYLQYQAPWGTKMYGKSTITQAGCGPTTAAMVLSYLTGKYITPDVTAIYAQTNGYHVSAGTSWAFFGAIASQYNVHCKNIGMDYNTVLTELAKEHPVIVSVGPGTFTKNGHFIVLRGLDTDGNVLVNDPNDSSTKQFYKKSFTINHINNEAKSYWSFWK